MPRGAHVAATVMPLVFVTCVRKCKNLFLSCFLVLKSKNKHNELLLLLMLFPFLIKPKSNDFLFFKMTVDTRTLVLLRHKPIHKIMTSYYKLTFKTVLTFRKSWNIFHSDLLTGYKRYSERQMNVVFRSVQRNQRT